MATPLADRLAQLAARYGSDAAAWQREIHALASLEGNDPKAAHARFHELKRRMADARRAELLAQLRTFPFLHDVPDAATAGMRLKEVEREMSLASRALREARKAQEAMEEAACLRDGLRLRRAPPSAPLPDAPWTEAARVAEAAERARRAAAREARVEARIRAVQQRARKLRDARVDVPDLSADAAPSVAEVDARLDALEAEISQAETVENVHRAVVTVLKRPGVTAFRQASRKRLLKTAREALAEPDRAAAATRLRALVPEAEALAREAAALANEAARARRSGRAAPEPERRSSDAMDYYG